MPAVWFPAIPVVNPDTGLPLLEARGAVGNIVAAGTTTPLHLSKDKAGTINLPQPITVTPGGYIPSHWNQDGFEDAVFVPLSGTWSTPISSPSGLRDAALDAVTAAEVAADAAGQAAADAAEAAVAARAPTDSAVATVLGTPGSAARTQAIALIEETAPNSGPGGGTPLTSWADQVATLPDIPATFRPTIGSTVRDAVAGNDPRLGNERIPTDGSVTDTKVAATGPTNPGISLDKTRDGSTRLAMTPSERQKLADLGTSGPGASRVDYARKVNGAWPARPTADANVLVFWVGPNPAPPIVPSGTGGMLDNVDMRLVTP